MEREAETDCMFSPLGLCPGLGVDKEILLSKDSYGQRSLCDLEATRPCSAGHPVPDKGHHLEVDEGAGSSLAKLIGPSPPLCSQ